MDDPVSFWDHLKRCASEQGRVATDLSFSVRTRGPVTFQLVSTPVSKDGKVVAYRTILTDKSQQVRASEQLPRLLMERVKDYAIIMRDPYAKVATWNAQPHPLKRHC